MRSTPRLSLLRSFLMILMGVHPSAPGSHDWLEITDQPGALEAARESANRLAADDLRKQIDAVLAGDFLTSDRNHLLANVGAVRAQLLPILNSGKLDQRVAFAALTLVALRTPEARPVLIKCMASAKPDVALKLIAAFPDLLPSGSDKELQSFTQFLNEGGEFQKLIVSKLDSPAAQIVSKWLWLAWRLELPIAQQYWDALQRRPDMLRSRAFFEQLAERELTSDVVDLAIATTKSSEASPARAESPVGLPVLEAAMKRGTPPVRRRAREVVLRLYQANDSKDIRQRLERIQLFSLLASTADSDDLPWVRANLESGKMITETLLSTLARLAPDEGRIRIKRALERAEERAAAFGAIADAYANSEEEEFASLLAQLAISAPADHLYKIARTLSAVGSPRALKELRALLPRLEPSNRMELLQQARVPLGYLVRRAREAGLLDESGAARLSESQPEKAASTKTGPSTVFDALDASDVVFSIVLESIPTAIRHDQLLLAFAAHTRKKVTFSAVSERRHTQPVEGVDSPSTLQFEYAGRLYVVKLRDDESSYDFQRLIGAANRALEDGALPERFMLLKVHSEFTLGVFADPERLLPFAKEFSLPVYLPPSPSNARSE